MDRLMHFLAALSFMGSNVLVQNPLYGQEPEPPPAPSIIGTWNAMGTNIEIVFEKINMNLVAAGKAQNPYFEVAVSIIEEPYSQGVVFIFEENGVL